LRDDAAMALLNNNLEVEKNEEKNENLNNKSEELDIPADVQALLEKTYWTPSHDGSYLSAQQIKRVLKRTYQKNVGLSLIQKWLNNQRTYTLHKPARINFSRNPTIAEYIDQQWQGDILFLPDLAQFNDRYNCALVCIDIVSRFAWIEPMRSKTGIETTAAFQKILDRAKPRKPEKFQTDDGKEFFNHHFQNLMKQNNIKHFSTKSDKKAAIAERFIKTIKEKIYRYMDVNPSNNRYIETLPGLIESYNNTYHTKIKMSPASVNKKNMGQVLWNLYHELWDVDRVKEAVEMEPKFRVGDAVRLSGDQSQFQKGYKGNWTKEMFTVAKIKRALPHFMYLLKDLNEEDIIGAVYEEQLLKVSKPKDEDFWQIEKIIQVRRTGRNKEKEYFVKWDGYPDTFNSWIKEKDMKQE